MIERQELHCHNCDRYVQFSLDLNLNGNHVLNCPNCGHEHCRVVKNGKITGDRWDSRNGSYVISYATTSITSTFTSYNSTATTVGTVILYNAWMNTTTGT